MLFEPGTETTASIGPEGGRSTTVVTTRAVWRDGIRGPATRLETLHQARRARVRTGLSERIRAAERLAGTGAVQSGRAEGIPRLSRGVHAGLEP